METATEVGGDYYDYRIAENGALTLAIGDATGHGTKAGTMVAAIQSLFVANGGTLPLPWSFEKCSETLRQMRFKNMFMGLQMARFHNSGVQFISAGMPTALVYRKSIDHVETIEIKTLPLGAPKVAEFKQIDLELSPGDIILLMSDGYPELFNVAGEMLGETRMKDIFHAAAQLPTTKIIPKLVEQGRKWTQTTPQRDDVTFVVIRVQD